MAVHCWGCGGVEAVGATRPQWPAGPGAGGPGQVTGCAPRREQPSLRVSVASDACVFLAQICGPVEVSLPTASPVMVPKTKRLVSLFTHPSFVPALAHPPRRARPLELSRPAGCPWWQPLATGAVDQ